MYHTLTKEEIYTALDERSLHLGRYPRRADDRPVRKMVRPDRGQSATRGIASAGTAANRIPTGGGRTQRTSHDDRTGLPHRLAHFSGLLPGRYDLRPAGRRRIGTPLSASGQYSQIWCTITGGAYQIARRVSTCVRNICKSDSCLNRTAECTKRVQALFSSLSFLLREKR